MKLSFIPGDLHLARDSNGDYVVRIAGRELLRTQSQKAALSKFNAARADMESKYPAHKLSAEELAEAYNRMLGDYLVGHNSLGGRKKKTTAGSTRTFGG